MDMLVIGDGLTGRYTCIDLVEVTRRDTAHSGTLYEMSSSTTTKRILEEESGWKCRHQ